MDNETKEVKKADPGSVEYQKRYRNANSARAKYQNDITSARRFINQRGNPEDLNALADLLEKRFEEMDNDPSTIRVKPEIVRPEGIRSRKEYVDSIRKRK
ncbi:MAG: hypothetical protein ACK5NA_08405 [Enterococcus sp.]